MKKTKLGQHFLTRPEIAGWVAQSIEISEDDTVLEIGPGHGILTRELLKVAKTVVAVEKDAKLVEELKKTFENEIVDSRLVILEKDIRDFIPKDCEYLRNGYALCANIPYYITGYIIRMFLTSEHQPDSIAILIQREVAERIVAKNNKHSILSLSVHAYGTPKLVRVVKAGAFSPPPKVDSAILSIKNISRNNFKYREHEKRFFEIIKTAFSQKRKTLGATLKKILEQDKFMHCEINKKARPEDIPLKKWLCLSEKQ